MQQTGLLSAQTLSLFSSHVFARARGEEQSQARGKKEKCDRSSCPPANRKRQCSLCPRLLWSQPSGGVISEESRPPGERHTCLFKAQDVWFQARLSEENVSGVVGNCQGVAIRPLKCFKWFLVCCYAVVRVFWKIIRWLFLPVLWFALKINVSQSGWG